MIICIPSKAFPAFPKVAAARDGSTYTEDACDDCGASIWLGTNSAVLAKEGMPKVCIACAIYKRGITQEHLQDMTVLNNKKAMD